MPTRPRTSVRRPLAVLGLAGLAVVAATSVAGAAPSRPAADATLVVDKSFDVKTIDPQRQYEPTGGIVDLALYDTLLRFQGGDVAHPKPFLARGYTASKDAKTYTFQLRQNVKFSDGTPLTSADVVFSFRRLVNLKGNPSFLLAGITTSAKGPYAVVLRSKTSNPAIPALVANTSLGVVNSKLARAHGGTDAANADKADQAESFLNSTSAGSGAYTLKSYSTTSQITLAANPTYWGPKAHYGTVVVRNVQAAAQLLDVQRGKDEVALDLSADQAKSLGSSVAVQKTPSANVFFLFANRNAKVSTTASNLHFQNAVRYALDYPGYVRLAGTGAVQAAGVVPSMLLGALPGPTLKQDLARAKTELAAAKLDRPSVKLEYPSDISANGLQFGTLAQKIKSDLAKVGIDVQLAGSPVQTALDTYRGGTEELGLWYWGPDYPDPNDYLAFLPGATVGLRAGWPAGGDKALETLGAKAASTPGATVRASQYKQIQRRLNSVGPFFPLVQPGQVVAASKNLTGTAFNVVYWIDVAAVGSR